jgi:hypothetical protein
LSMFIAACKRAGRTQGMHRRRTGSMDGFPYNVEIELPDR